MLNLVDGPFNIADLYKTYIIENIDISEFGRFVQHILTIQPAELQALAQKYFKSNEMTYVVAGIAQSPAKN
jgi:predicted Zn-dependent peptidase